MSSLKFGQYELPTALGEDFLKTIYCWVCIKSLASPDPFSGTRELNKCQRNVSLITEMWFISSSSYMKYLVSFYLCVLWTWPCLLVQLVTVVTFTLRGNPTMKPTWSSLHEHPPVPETPVLLRLHMPSHTQQNSYSISHLLGTVTRQWLDSDGIVTVDNCQQHSYCVVTVPSRWLMGQDLIYFAVYIFKLALVFKNIPNSCTVPYKD